MTEPPACDLMIINGDVVTLDDDRTRHPAGAVAISGTRIADLGPTEDLVRRWRPARTLDARGGLVHPGFVECHTHATIHTSRGLLGDDITWLKAVDFYADWWNALQDEDEHVATLLACVELLRNGATCFLEAGTAFEPDAVASAATQVGIRALVGDPFVWDTGGFSSDSPTVHRAPVSRKRALDLLGRELRRNDDPDALVRGHVALIGMGSASEELEVAASDLARRNRVVLNQHQSYCADDVADDDSRFGRHPLVHLGELGMLGSHCTFAHMNILRDDEVEPICASGMSIAWCPAASMIWGVGGATYGRHLELLRAGVNVALGSDSVNWSGRFDLGEQAYLAILTARDRTRDRAALGVPDALRMLTVNGAQAVGLADEIGTLEAGKRADLVVRRTDHPEMQPDNDPLWNLIFGARSKSVRSVVVNGEIAVDDGRCTRIDEDEVFAAAAASALRVIKRVGAGAR